MKFFTQTQMKISIHPNQWIINYVGTRYRISPELKTRKNEANHQRGRLFTQSMGDTKGGEKNASGGVARRGV